MGISNKIHGGTGRFPSSRIGNEAGFSLIEVLVATSLLTIGIFAVTAMMVASMRTNAQSVDTTIISTGAQDKLEELTALPVDSPWLESAANPPNNYKPGDTGLPTDSAGEEHHEATPEGLDIIWRVEDDTPADNAKKITVTVWGRNNRSISLSSITAVQK